METLLPFIPTLILGYLLWWTTRRADEAQKAHRLEKLGILERWAAEAAEWRSERGELLTRIQAPQQAVVENYEPNIMEAVPFDDDEAYWEAREVS